ncbi:MAG TPA: RluA family pseudouridine synthase [Verrucomicrobiae bacterium]|nr:RluA family pseudouridine synthase [Verrucomicrobiae bacterium]
MNAAIKLSSPATREFWEIPVLFEDEHLLALDKPAGLLTSPDRYDPQRPNLMKLLHTAIAAGKPWARERCLTYLANAHRLDFETSGVILLAKSKPALVALANLFGSEKPFKKYVALVAGAPESDQFAVNAPLAAHPMNPALMRVDPKNGKKSKTEFEVLERFSGWTLLRCQPLTGRTHQIRVHLRHVGLPIVGDSLYGGRPLWLSQLKKNYRLKPGRQERPLISRVALHAEALELPHPVTGRHLKITAPWPKDLKVAVKYLGKFAGQNFSRAETQEGNPGEI